jgi:hypothetical protein
MKRAFLLIPFLTLLTSCVVFPEVSLQSQIPSISASEIVGDEGLVFEKVKQTGYLKDNPALFKHLVEELEKNPDMLGNVDPRRFPYTAYRGLYFVEPAVGCREGEVCPRNFTREEISQYLSPYCNHADACHHFVFIYRDGKYQEVFFGPFWRTGLEDRIPLAVSKQQQSGIPLCVEYKATYFPKRDEKPPNFDDRTQRLITRFCWHDAQKIYIFNGVRAIAEDFQPPPEVKK